MSAKCRTKIKPQDLIRWEKKRIFFGWLKREIQSNKENGLQLSDRNPGRSEEATPSIIKGFGNLGFRQAELKWCLVFHNVTLGFSLIANTLFYKIIIIKSKLQRFYSFALTFSKNKNKKKSFALRYNNK